MGYTRQLGQLAYLITFDGSGNITVPAALTQGSVTSSMLKADSSGKLVAAVAGTDFVAPAGLSAYVPTTRTITINGTSYDLSADRSWSIVSGVSSFNTRTGSITLLDTDVTGALGYTPVTNARTLTINGTTYDLSANRSWTIVAGLSSFNTRTGDITLLDTDVTGALGYTPVTNARTITINGTTYDLSANRTWVVDTSSVTTRVIQKFTATSLQTTFTITGGYTVGMVDVFLNGIKLDNATEFTASNGSTVVLALGAATGDIVEVYKYGGQFIANNTLRQSTLFTTTAGQTTFTVNYSVGFVDVFYNGSKLDSSEFTATNGTSIVLGTACVLNDKVEVVAYNYTVGAFTGVGGSGTTNYISKWTASGTLGNSLIFDNGTNVGIGTSSPTQKLTIGGTTDAYINFAPTSFRNFIIGSDTLGFIVYDNNASAYRMVLNSSGNLGIGTSSPTDYSGYTTLHINGKSGAAGGLLRLTAFNDSSSVNIYAANGINFNTTSAVPFIFLTQDTERMRITSSGNVGIGTSNPNSEASATNLVVRGVSGKTNGWVQSLSYDGLSSIAFYSGASQADNPSIIYLKDLRFGRAADSGTAGYVELMRLTNSGNLIVGQENGATTTAKITSYLGNSNITGTNDGFRMQAYSYSNASRNTIAWGQDSQNLTLARFGLEWNSGTSQMNFVWRDMYNVSSGTTENMRLTGAGHLQIPNQPYFKYGIGDRTITSTVRFGTDWSFPVLTSRDSIDSSHFNKANGRFTAPVAGVYVFGCTIMRNATAGSGPIDFQIVKNEPNPIGQSSSSTWGRGYAGSYSTDYQQTTIVVTIKLAANDYVALDFSGNMSTYGDDSWFYGYLLG